MKIFCLLLILLSCARITGRETHKEGKTNFSFTDVSGTFNMSHEHKLIGSRLVTRNQILSPQGGTNRILEKSVLVSQLGSVKGKKGRNLSIRPVASEFSIWLEGKRYSSNMKLDTKNKSMVVTMDSPDPKWKGTQSVPFPKGRNFCFYSQIPECLLHNQLLDTADRNRKQVMNFFVVWESYPYLQEQFTGVGYNLFSPATLKFDGEMKGQLRFEVEVEGQIILYQFSKSLDLVRIAWVAQGITIVPPGEATRADEE